MQASQNELAILPHVIILMSTYNGERYVSEQIQSIREQTFKDWQLWIRDDGSCDSTVKIVGELAAQDARIKLVKDELGNLGAAQSFGALATMAERALPQQAKRNNHTNEMTIDTCHLPFFFFCDQDDVWLPTKLEKQTQQLQTLEETYGRAYPLLIHSDLKVVDQHLHTINNSFLKHENIKRNTTDPIRTLLINNFVTGCTMGMNAALLRMATPFPASMVMHDWWCALCAAVSGRIAFMNEATVLYRQHGKNTIGSHGFYHKLLSALRWKFLFGEYGLRQKVANLRLCFNQADALLRRIHEYDYVNRRTNLELKYLQRFCKLHKNNRVIRYCFASQIRLKPTAKTRGILFWLMLAWV